ncbi:MAG TPA: CHASE2 domain-containing protein [Chitinophagaceae bacterium]
MKHLHKKIGRKVRNLPRHITKYLYERDTIFATLWVFVFIIVLGSIPLNLGVINPIKLSMKDFDSNDMSYSKYLKKAEHTALDKNITIVNIGHADRELLSIMIDKVAGMKPKVMALDAYFDGPMDPAQDSMLSETFKRNKNLIVAEVMQFKSEEGDSVYFRGNYISTASQYAFANIFQDSLATIRSYDPFIEDKADKKKYKSFSSAIVESYDPAAFKKLEKKGSGKLLINYTRRLNQYKLVQIEDLMTEDGVVSSYFKDKIVLFGYINDDPNDISDKKFTPMNRRFYGKTVPDMNGIVVHANIISMALEDNYIKKLPSWANWLIAILICWLHMSFFIRYYLESHIWFHLVAKIAQVASAIFFVWLGIYLFDQYRIKVDMKLSILVIVMAVDVIYFYEAWAVWMHKKFHYHTVFKPHHH